MIEYIAVHVPLLDTPEYLEAVYKLESVKFNFIWSLVQPKLYYKPFYCDVF